MQQLSADGKPKKKGKQKAETRHGVISKMVDRILAHKDESDDNLSGDEQPKKPVFQITTVPKQTGDSKMDEEETKEPASDVAEQTDEFNEEADYFEQQEVSDFLL